MCIVHDLRFTSATKCMLEKGAVLEVYSLGRSLLHSLAIIYCRKLLDTMKN